MKGQADGNITYLTILRAGAPRHWAARILILGTDASPAAVFKTTGTKLPYMMTKYLLASSSPKARMDNGTMATGVIDLTNCIGGSTKSLSNFDRPMPTPMVIPSEQPQK